MIIAWSESLGAGMKSNRTAYVGDGEELIGE